MYSLSVKPGSGKGNFDILSFFPSFFLFSLPAIVSSPVSQDGSVILYSLFSSHVCSLRTVSSYKCVKSGKIC